PTGLPERAMRATTCTFWPGAKARPGTTASDALSDTLCGKRLSRRLTASGGPGCAGSRTNTNNGAAWDAAGGTEGATETYTRTTAPACAAAGAGAPPES